MQSAKSVRQYYGPYVFNSGFERCLGNWRHFDSAIWLVTSFVKFLLYLMVITGGVLVTYQPQTHMSNGCSAASGATSRQQSAARGPGCGDSSAARASTPGSYFTRSQCSQQKSQVRIPTWDIFSRRILVESVPDFYSFFRRVRSTFLFICSTTSNLNNFEPQKRVQNKKKKQPPHFFSALCDFFETFWIGSPHQRVPPSFVCFDILQHNECQKIPKGPPFNIFRHCDSVQKSHFKNFLGNFFKSPKGSPLIFFHILQPAGFSQSPKGPPFTILSLRYSADFGRSRLVFTFNAFCRIPELICSSSVN